MCVICTGHHFKQFACIILLNPHEPPEAIETHVPVEQTEAQRDGFLLKDTQHVSGGVRAGTQIWATLDLSPQPPCCPASWVSVTSSAHLQRLWPTHLLPLVAGCSLPPPPLDVDDALPDLDLLPPPPPPPPADLPPPDEEPHSAMGASLISDLEQLHLPPPPPPPQVLPTPGT